MKCKQESRRMRNHPSVLLQWRLNAEGRDNPEVEWGGSNRRAWISANIPEEGREFVELLGSFCFFCYSLLLLLHVLTWQIRTRRFVCCLNLTVEVDS